MNGNNETVSIDRPSGSFHRKNNNKTFLFLLPLITFPYTILVHFVLSLIFENIKDPVNLLLESDSRYLYPILAIYIVWLMASVVLTVVWFVINLKKNTDATSTMIVSLIVQLAQLPAILGIFCLIIGCVAIIFALPFVGIFSFFLYNFLPHKNHLTIP